MEKKTIVTSSNYRQIMDPFLWVITKEAILFKNKILREVDSSSTHHRKFSNRVANSTSKILWVLTLGRLSPKEGPRFLSKDQQCRKQDPKQSGPLHKTILFVVTNNNSSNSIKHLQFPWPVLTLRPKITMLRMGSKSNPLRSSLRCSISSHSSKRHFKGMLKSPRLSQSTTRSGLLKRTQIVGFKMWVWTMGRGAMLQGSKMILLCWRTLILIWKRSSSSS